MTRLDAALAARGLARSRSHAATLIAEGRVRIGDRAVIKASTPVGDDDELRVDGADQYVSRAAQKLITALDGFGISPTGLLALDMGASTGGFTQVLRERGARRVLAVDVGHGQLAPQIAQDEGVVAVEGFNVRHMTPSTLAAATGEDTPPEIVTGDLSFISLDYVLPATAAVAASSADIVLLIKPQFEVGRTAVRGGLVTDAATRIDAVERTLWSAWDAGLAVHGLLSSPILGTHGNAEYLVHLRARLGTAAADPSEWTQRVTELVGGR